MSDAVKTSEETREGVIESDSRLDRGRKGEVMGVVGSDWGTGSFGGGRQAASTAAQTKQHQARTISSHGMLQDDNPWCFRMLSPSIYCLILLYVLFRGTLTSHTRSTPA